MTDKLGARASHQALVASDGAATHLHPPRFDPSRIGRWFSISDDGPPEPEVFVLCWDGYRTFVEWRGSKLDFGRSVTHWIPYEMPPGARSDMHDGRRAFAIATEAATAAETTKIGSVHEGAGRRHRQTTPSLQTPQGGDS